MPGDILVGVISDTHGLLRPEAVDSLRGVSLILHAGDVGKPEVLEALRRLAPTLVVRGNVDHGDWASRLPVSEIVQVGDHSFYMLHDIGEFDLDLPTAGFAAMIFGHSHQPSIETRGGVLFLNPGSAGPRRFKLPVSVAHIRVSGAGLDPEIVILNV
jgi:uncharacterized protein